VPASKLTIKTTKLSHADKRLLAGRTWEVANDHGRAVKQELDRAIALAGGRSWSQWRDKYVNIRKDRSGDVVIRLKVCVSGCSGDAVLSRLWKQVKRWNRLPKLEGWSGSFYGGGCVVIIKVPFTVTDYAVRKLRAEHRRIDREGCRLNRHGLPVR
jgi:hypothetical protein